MILLLRRLDFNAKYEPAMKAQVRQNMCFVMTSHFIHSMDKTRAQYLHFGVLYR
jgi:hypothetical protein